MCIATGLADGMRKKNGNDGGIRFCCCNYDMWGYVAHTPGNGCQIQKVVDMGIFHSHRAYLCSTFSVMSRCMVSFLQ
jgi:hypothetical protein